MTTPVGRFLAADEESDLVRSLQADLETFLTEFHSEWGPRHARALDEQHRSGWLERWVWRSSSGDRSAIAYVQRTPQGLRIHGLGLRPPSVETLAEVLADIGRSHASPVEAVTDLLPGVPRETQPEFFRHRGFWPRAKVRMRRPAGLPVAPTLHAVQARRVRTEDRADLLRLFVEAYAERPGEFWAWSAIDPQSDARCNVDPLYEPPAEGKPVPDLLASCVGVLDGRVVGAILVDRRGNGPLYIGDVIVTPTLHRRGIGRHLLSSTLRAYPDAVPAFELAAIRLGAPYWLYYDLGFREVTGAEDLLDGHWVHGEDPTGPYRDRRRATSPST